MNKEEQDKVIMLVLTTTRQNPGVIRQAVDEAKLRGARLHTLYILESETPDDVFSRLTDSGFIGEKPSHQISSAIMDEYRMRGEATLREVEEMSQAEGIQASGKLKSGDFVSESIAEVRELHPELVFVTRKRRSSIVRYIMGSPVDRLKQMSRCEVKIVEE